MGDTKRRLKIERGAKRIRALLGGTVVADTTAPLLVWESPYYPQYYLPAVDVRTELLTPTGHTTRSPSRGEASHFSVTVGDVVATDAAWQHVDSPIEEIRDHLRFEWDAMDRWFEEDVEVFVHPRDPYRRVDVLQSSRHVEVQIDGVTVADSTRPTLLFETGLPTRYYLPALDVRLDLLEPSTTTTDCPYKGTASYHSVRIGDELVEDVVWHYPAPVHESAGIAGLHAFYDEKVDVLIDGVHQERPGRTPWA